MIEIHGLNAHQRILADILWNLDSMDQVNTFFSTLDDEERMEAKTVLEMIILATFDEDNGTSIAKRELKRFML
jgi:hypothetical protein